MTTRGVQYLEKRKVPYENVKYDHMEKGAEFAAKAVHFPLNQTIKTLVVTLDGNLWVPKATFLSSILHFTSEGIRKTLLTPYR